MAKRKSKSRVRAAEVSQFRRDLVWEVGRCEVCGAYDPTIVPHEIAGGSGNRQQALDKRFAILIVCMTCHKAIHAVPVLWTRIRQLAFLYVSRPDDLDLEKFCALIGRSPTAITKEEVLCLVPNVMAFKKGEDHG